MILLGCSCGFWGKSDVVDPEQHPVAKGCGMVLLEGVGRLLGEGGSAHLFVL